jgi:hypothetical protein
MHQDVEITPEVSPNEGDVMSVVLDTFRGCYTIKRRDSTYLFGGKSKTECFTCQDLGVPNDGWKESLIVSP